MREAKAIAYTALVILAAQYVGSMLGANRWLA